MMNHDRFERELSILLRDHRSTLLEQVHVIRDFRDGLIDAGRARNAAHRLAGTLGLFGFGELGVSASRIEQDLEMARVPSDDLLDEFIEQVTDLLSE